MLLDLIRGNPRRPRLSCVVVWVAECTRAVLSAPSVVNAFSGIALLLVASGCQMSRREIVPAPLSGVEQAQEILSHAPLGTPRAQVVERLKQAGIDGSFGSAESIYYCDLWERPNGEVWHINVELLFDEAGRLYATRPPTSAAESTPAVESPTPPDPVAGARNGRRTAFAE